MEQAARAALKEYARVQLEERIRTIQRDVHEQTGQQVRRREIIGMADQQMQQVLILVQIGIERSRFSGEEIEERVEIMDEVLDELKRVPEVP